MTSASQLLTEPTPEWLNAHAQSLLQFAPAARHPLGFALLDAEGEPEPGHLELYVTCRLTYSYVLGEQLGFAGSAQPVEPGLTAPAPASRASAYAGRRAPLCTVGVGG